MELFLSLSDYEKQKSDSFGRNKMSDVITIKLLFAHNFENNNFNCDLFDGSSSNDIYTYTYIYNGTWCDE